MANWYDDVPAPMDADGREISFGTKVLYDLEGVEHKVLGYEFSTRYDGRWMVEIETQSYPAFYVTECFRTTKTDSWERLEKDVYNLVMSEYLDTAEDDVKGIISRAKALARQHEKEEDNE